MTSIFTPKKQALKFQKIAKPILFWQLVSSLGYVPLILSLITINYHNKFFLIFLMILNIPIGYLTCRIAKVKQTFAPFGLTLGLWSYTVGKGAINKAKTYSTTLILITLLVQILLYIKYT